MSVLSRRALTLGLLGAGLAHPSLAHTPYGQWVVYRQKHLLVGCHKRDPAGYALAKAIVAELAAHLPDAKARVARAPAASRLASLIATEQLDVAVLEAASAAAMASGGDGFASTGRIELTTLVPLEGRRVLVAHARFPERHGRLVADALSDMSDPGDPLATTLPMHPGALKAATERG